MNVFRKYLSLIIAVSLFLQQVSPLYGMEQNPNEEETSFPKKKVNDNRKDLEEKEDNTSQEGGKAHANKPFQISSISTEKTSPSEIINFLFPEIRSYITRYIINEEKINEEKKRQKFRLFLKGTVLVIGLTAGVPYLTASCDAAEGVLPLCISYSVGNLISYGASTAWFGLLLVDYIKPKSTEEIAIINRINYRSRTKNILSNTLGLLSSFPDVYAVYKYNDGGFKLLAIQALIIDYFYKYQGYYKLYEYISEYKNPINPDFQRLCVGIEKTLIPYILENPEEALPKIKNEKIFYELLEQAYNYSSNHSEKNITDPDLWVGGFPKSTFKTTSLWFPIGNMFVTGLLSYDGLRLIGVSQVVSIALTPLFFIPTFALNVFAITVNTADPVFDSAYNTLRCRRVHKTFLQKYYPNLSRTIPFASFVLAVFSVAGDVFVVSDTVSNSIFKSLRIILPASVFIANIVFESYGSNSLIKELCVNTIACYSSKIKKETIQAIKKLESLSSLLLSLPSAVRNEDPENISLLRSNHVSHHIDEEKLRTTHIKKNICTKIAMVCNFLPLTFCILLCLIILIV